MNKLNLLLAASLLSVGVAQASTPCNGFDIKITNKLADSLEAVKVKMNGANLQPGAPQKIESGRTQTFTVQNSVDNIPMQGELELYTLSLPSKKVTVNFTLQNKGAICEHTDIVVSGNDYSVTNSRNIGNVEYSIFNK